MSNTPHSATGDESWEALIESSPLSHFIIDRPIVDLLDLPALQDPAPANLLSHGSGTAALVEINSSEICGVKFVSDNDSHGILWMLPSDIDLSKQIDFRCLWSNSEAAGTGSCLFSVVYTPLSVGSTALAVGSTALDTVIEDQADLAANVLQWTSWGSIAAKKSTIAALVPGDDALALKVAVDLTTIADATLYQVQARFYRKYVM